MEASGLDVPAALRLHREGRLAEAERLYRRALDVDPGDADAIHLLGVLAQQSGRTAEALGLLRRAAGIDPSASHFRCNLGSIGNRVRALSIAFAPVSP